MTIKWKHRSLLGLKVERDKAFAHPSCPGLRLRVYPNGKKVWQWKRALAKRPFSTTLGQFPAMPMAVAEARASELNKLLALGHDPLAKPKPVSEPVRRMTVEEAWSLYISDCVRRNRKSVHIRDLTGKKWIVEIIGNLFVRDVTTTDVQTAVDAPLHSKWKGRTGGAVRSNGVLKVCKTFFRFCVQREWDGIQRNPADAIAPIPLASIKGSRPKRRLTIRELALIILAAREFDRRNDGKTAWGDTMTLLVMNGCRKSEVFNAFGDEWNGKLGLWIIDPARYKTSAECVLPVGPTTAEIFGRRAVPGAYVIPSQSGVRTGAYVFFRDKLWRIMEGLHGQPIAKWTFHDIRHGFRTNIRKARLATKEVAEKIIHPSPSIDDDERYDDDWLDDMRDALAKWDERVNQEILLIKAVSLAA